MKAETNILKNSLIIYIQTIITLLLSLLVSRMLLKNFGVENFGLFSLVGGVINFFIFLNISMTVSTQRHISYAVGKGDLEELQRTVSVTIFLHLCIALIIVVFAETLGLWIYYNILNIPDGKLTLGFWIYQFSLLSLVLRVLNVPYQAILTSYERFNVIVGLTIFYSFFQAVFSIIIIYFTIDRVLLYVFLLSILNFAVLLVYFIQSKYIFFHLKLKPKIDLSLIKELAVFAGWNVFSSMAYIIKGQGIAIVLNIFFGVIINSAYGIAMQVGSALMQFGQSILRPFNPRIIKSYSKKAYTEMFEYVFISTRISYYIVFFFSVIIILESEFLLGLWLHEIPVFAEIFCILLIINTIIEVLSYPLMYVAQATGKIIAYQISNSILLLSNIPLSIIILKVTLDPILCIVLMVLITVLTLISRILFVWKLAKLNPFVWCKQILLKISLPSIITILILMLLKSFFPAGLIRVIVLFSVEFILYISLIWIVGLKEEKQYIKIALLNFSYKYLK